MNRAHDSVVLVRPGDSEHFGVAGGNELGRRAHAARHDDPAVLGQRFADRGERLFARAIYESAGIDHDDIGIGIIRCRRVAFGPQTRENALGVDESFGASKAYEADTRGTGCLLIARHSARF